MGWAQFLQVVFSLGVVGLCLFLAARLAQRRFGTTDPEAMRLVSRQAVSRTQNLVVVQVEGTRHLIAMTDGGASTVDSWEAPEQAQDLPATAGKAVLKSPTGGPGLSIGSTGTFADLLAVTEPKMPKWSRPRAKAQAKEDRAS